MSKEPIEAFHWESVPSQEPSSPKKKETGGIIALLISLLCIVLVATMLLTYTLTSAYVRDRYTDQIQEQQNTIDQLKAVLENGGGNEFQKLEFLSALFKTYSYYSDSIDQEAVIEAVLRAYIEATGDLYAEYYTEEEYYELMKDRSGSSEGIGVSVTQTQLTIDSVTYDVAQIIAVYQNSPAGAAGVQVGDYLYGIKQEDAYLTVAEMGGFTTALNALRGESGTQAEFVVFRWDGDSYQSLEFSITRAAFTKESVTYCLSEADPTVGIVKLMEFDMTTPTQLKAAVGALMEAGAEHYVFDVRNNPGGDLQSIKAVLTYFLEEGDLILSAIDNEGTAVRSYYAEAQTFSGSYAPCSVAEDEVGMYADLDIVVLCNENTASAAEVFTASLRDHKQTPIIGQTTYGKGIMQSFISLASASNWVYGGWVKLTTYAYVTECGVTYHDIGIAPNVPVELSDEAKEYSLYVLPQSLDDQLQAAIACVKQ